MIFQDQKHQAYERKKITEIIERNKVGFYENFLKEF